MTEQELRGVLEQIKADVDVAHAGLLDALELRRQIQTLAGMGYAPPHLQRIAAGFEAINSAHSALKTALAVRN